MALQIRVGAASMHAAPNEDPMGTHGGGAWGPTGTPWGPTGGPWELMGTPGFIQLGGGDHLAGGSYAAGGII